MAATRTVTCQTLPDRNVLIRPYTPADRPACLALFRGNEPRFFAPAERPGFGRWLDAQDAGRPAYAENQAEPYFVLEQAGQVRACGGYCVAARQPEVTLAWGMVANAHHGQGLGKHLLQYRLADIQARYAGYRIGLDTSQHSYPFFEKLGFAVTRITPNGYGPGLDRYDMALTRPR